MNPDERLLLTMLLDRYERSSHYRAPGQSARAVCLRFDAASLPDYWDERSGQRRVELNLAAQQLAAAGLVTLRLSRYSREEIERIDLVLSRLEEAYRAAERVPRRAQEESIAAVAREWAARWPAPDWRHAFALAVTQAVDEHEKLPLGLKPDDAPLVADLCRLLDRLGPTGLSAELPRRVFSQQTLGSSKRLEALQPRLARLLREFGPTPLPENDKEALAEFGIVENPQHLLLAGPVVLDGLDVALTGAGLGLPASFVQRCQVTRLAAERLITVENLTSFHLAAASLPPRTLALYLGGYHNRVRRHLLTKLAQAGVREFWHWGDIDLGGFRIFVHLQEQTGLPLQPLLMDTPTYRCHLSEGMAFGESYGRELAALLDDRRFQPFWPVIRAMLDARRRVEQEAVAFALPG